MKKKLLSVFLALNIFAMAGCGSEEGSATENWIDSDIEGNISAETTISEKDDFAAAANRELYESGDFSGAAIRNISRTVTERKREIVEDSSITGKGIEEVRKYINLAEDIDQRNSLGSEPLLPYIRDIESISSVEELYDWMVDTDRNPLGVAPVKAFGPGRSEVDPSAYYVLLDSGRLTLPTGSGMDDGYYHLGEQSLEKMVIIEEKSQYSLPGLSI